MDAQSIDNLRKRSPQIHSLSSFFHSYFAHFGPYAHEQALKRYIESMAAYSLITYLLQIKDRHNGNIMLSRDGGISHIDFGFFLTNSPGQLDFEGSSNFKLTTPFLEIMGGEQTKHFDYFVLLFIRGLMCVRKHYHKFVLLVGIMSRDSDWPCFRGGRGAVLQGLAERFAIDKSSTEAVEHAHSIINTSINTWRNYQYDLFQKVVNDIEA